MTIVMPYWFAVAAITLWGAHTALETTRIVLRWYVRKRLRGQIDKLLEQHKEQHNAEG